MYAVSEEYLQKIAATNRRVFGKITINFTEPFLDKSINVVTSESARTSYPKQVANTIDEPHGKIFSLDGSCTLDGSYVLAPAASESYDLEMGWWGTQFAGVGGVLAPPYPTISIGFFSRPVRALKVVGDSVREEWPVDFTINLYNSADEVLYTKSVTGNTQVSWGETLVTEITGVVKQELIITKWSHEDRQVKIVEFFTTIEETFEDDEIVSIDLIEEKEGSSYTLPIGSISANELDIKLLNKNRQFDPNNTDSKLYNLIRANRRIRAWLGIEKDSGEKEFIPLGTFWSDEWDVPERQMYARTFGRDRLEQLRVSDYKGSRVIVNATLYDLAVIIFQDAGIRSSEYEIDESLKDITIPYSYFESQTHREALQKIAEASLCQVYCDRLSVIKISPTGIASAVLYPGMSVDDDLYLLQEEEAVEGITYRLVDGELLIDMEQGLTKSNYFNKSSPAKREQIANYIEVITNPLTPAAEAREVYASDDEEISAGETKILTCFYNEVPCMDATATLTGEGSIIDVEYFAWGASIEVSSAVAGTFSISITAKPLTVANQRRIVAQDTNSIADNGLIKYQFPSNNLVQTVSQAQDIASALVAYYSRARKAVFVDWRGDPAWLLNDNVVVGDDYTLGLFNVIRQEINYNGTLRAKLDGEEVDS